MTFRIDMFLDFETYSEAGRVFNPVSKKWGLPPDARLKGLALVGTRNYCAHPSTEVLVACFGRPGEPISTWRPGETPPLKLLSYVEAGGIITARNAVFEYYVWTFVCTRLYRWPEVTREQFFDSAALCYRWGLPGGLESSANALFGAGAGKTTGGHAVMLKLSQPRNPTKKNKNTRWIRPEPVQDWALLDEYCARDVTVDINVTRQLPALSPVESQVYALDQRINDRGFSVDLPLVKACVQVMKEAKRRAANEISELTHGAITEVSQATAILKYVNTHSNEFLKDLRPESVTSFLQLDIPLNIKKLLEIRRDVGGQAPSKLKTMLFQSDHFGRIRDTYAYCGAQKTGRWAGRGVQPQNLPRGDISLKQCSTCGEFKHVNIKHCGCGGSVAFSPWSIESVGAIIPDLLTGDYSRVARWGNPAKLIGACLRATIVAKPGYMLMGSDFSAIEAVAMAYTVGETWVMNVFETDRKLYENTAARLLNVAVEDVTAEQRKIGKVADLASQYQGAEGAWANFGANKFLSKKEIKTGIKEWRAHHPATVHFWKACEKAAFAAVEHPETRFPVLRFDGTPTGFTYGRYGRALYSFFPNGEWITYIDPQIQLKRVLSSEGWDLLERNEKLSTRDLIKTYFKYAPSITYMGVQGYNWTRKDTYGGKLAANNIQGICRHILSDAMLRLEARGYPIVLHLHDEPVAEVPEGTGCIREFEQIMMERPKWARDWMIHATGGWSGHRFRK